MRLASFKKWDFHISYTRMFIWQLGVALEVSRHNICLYIHLAWLGNIYIQLDDAAYDCCASYK
jgi:hypothetical protein